MEWRVDGDQRATLTCATTNGLTMDRPTKVDIGLSGHRSSTMCTCATGPALMISNASNTRTAIC